MSLITFRYLTLLKLSKDRAISVCHVSANIFLLWAITFVPLFAVFCREVFANETGKIVGIDLSNANLDLARTNHKHSRASFIQDDAQELLNIPEHSIDVLICIESAFHYPDKNAFFRQIKRVLRTDGVFLIVDIIKSPSDNGKSWWFWNKRKLFFHANEEEYHQLSSDNSLVFKQTENITDRIIRGYEGHLSWIDRGKMNLSDYLLMKVFSRLQVRLNVAELRTTRQYILFYGEHGSHSV